MIVLAQGGLVKLLLGPAFQQIGPFFELYGDWSLIAGSVVAIGVAVYTRKPAHVLWAPMFGVLAFLVLAIAWIAISGLKS